MGNLLENVGFKKRIHVGVSLSANNFIELVCVDKQTRSVVKYASGNIKYNNAIREIMDFDEFTEVLESLFEEAGLDPQECSVTLNVPNVHFGITTLESVSETPFIIENLQSEIEDLYVFKRNEPIITYSILDNGKGRGQKNIVFSAIQTKIVARLIEIFDNMQCDLARIDTSYSSLLRAIKFCDRFSKYVEKDEKTTILLVTPNSCCAFYLENGVIIDCFEEPLAVKSFTAEEVYSTISKIAENVISKNSPENLLIISETDELNSELLASRLNFKGEIDCVNKNLNSNDSFIEISGIGSDIDSSMVSYMTIESVGAAVADFDEYPLNLNFLPAERINPNIIEVGEYEVDMYRFFIVVAVSAILLAFLIGFAIKTVLSMQLDSESTRSNTSKKKIEVFKTRLKENTKTQGRNLFPILKQVLDNNTSTLQVYDALSTEIPETIYIKKFVTNADGGIGLIGEATSSESVDAFVKGLREKHSDLMLSKLSVNTKHDLIPAKIPNGFTFEIKTSTKNVYMEEDDDLIQSAIMNTQQTLSNRATGRVNSTNNSARRSGSRNSLTPPPPVI